MISNFSDFEFDCNSRQSFTFIGTVVVCGTFGKRAGQPNLQIR